jgi:hypothetical protein
MSCPSARNAGFRIVLRVINAGGIGVQAVVVPRALGSRERTAAILQALFMAQGFVGLQVVFVTRGFPAGELAAGDTLVDAFLLIIETLMHFAGLRGLRLGGGCEEDRGGSIALYGTTHDSISALRATLIIAEATAGCK